ncbi:hypothetical protein FGB62_47g08 [Gracilaria domingensis]|nr:hypothetical protein FGB62_47g08 [Gracilaria domingensis]
MCQKESESQNSFLSQQNKPDELSTAQRFLEPETKKNALRNTEFAFILTALATAVAGGPIITAWSALYFLVGRENDVPLWVCSLASLICSALTDAFIWNFSDIHQNTGFIPYLLFASGTAVSAVVDFDEFFRMAIPSGLQRGKLKPDDSSSEIWRHERSSHADIDLSAWDSAFKDKQNGQD